MSTSKPNILIIMTDQQRGDCLSIEGHPCLMTPNMDELALSGIRFRHGYSTCPVCIPARRSLLSGQYPSSHGMVGYLSGQEWTPPGTLPQILRDAGYQTARPWPYDENLHFSNWTVHEARRFMQRRDSSCPYFLTVSFLAPHPPLIPPAFYFDRYLRLDIPPPIIGDWAEAPAGPATSG